MINTDPEVNAKAIELIADMSLTSEERSAQLADFIQMKNDQAIDEMISSIKKGQKRSRKPSQAQVIAGMKKFLCMQAGWKMTQLKGKNYEEIQVLYYRAFRRNKYFIPMDSQEEKTRYLRSTKKQKATEEISKDQSKQDEELTKDQLGEMIAIESEPKDFYVEPL